MIASILAGCLEPRKALRSDSFSSTSSWFKGVTSAKNLGGFPISILIGWESSARAKGYNIYVIDANQSSSWSLVATINDPNADSYIHRDASTLTPGRVYSYRVRAFEQAGTEDPNEVQKSTIAFEGIGRLEILSKTSAQVTVNTSGSFSRLRIVAHPSRLNDSDRSKDVATEFSSSQNTILVENLTPGTTYSFRAQALVNENGDVDGNEIGLRGQTPSSSYGSGADTEDTTKYDYRSVRLIQGFGDAPNALNSTTLSSAPTALTADASPHEKIIKIVPNPFAGSQSYRFRVIRTAGIGLTGNSAPVAFDTTVTAKCTNSSDASCVVCDHAAGSANAASGQCDLDFNAGIPTFKDKQLAPPPKKYFYTIAKVLTLDSTLWPEELPLVNHSDFLFAAHVPDPYMVLVQRDSANYEMCVLLNKPSNPRKFNRCNYRGIGASPYNTKGVKVDVPSGFYDFGYNVVIDRYALACKWTGSDITSGLPTTRPACGSAGGSCFSLGLTGGPTSTFGNESTIDVPPTALPSVNFTPNSTYASSPLALFNMQARGNNCYVGYFPKATLTNPAVSDSIVTSPASQAATWLPIGTLSNIGLTLSQAQTPELKSQIRSVVRSVATADPGPLAVSQGVSNRKRPVITGLTNIQAQSLCNSHESSYGTKRLMRRREYIAAVAPPSMAGEPGFTTQSNMNAIISGTAGQTLYNQNVATATLNPFGNGTNAGLGLNGGACASQTEPVGRIVSNPVFCYQPGGQCIIPQNNVISRLSREYCNSATCTLDDDRTSYFIAGRVDSSGAAVDPADDYINEFLSLKNESSQITDLQINTGNAFSSRYFIGSLATNKCLSRFGMQDPFASSSHSRGSGFNSYYNTQIGFIFSDQFQQTSTLNKTSSSPIYMPTNNSLDLGVSYDYRYNNGANTIEFSNSNSGYTAVGKNGSHTRLCSNSYGSSTNWYTNNYFFFTRLNTTDSDTTECVVDSNPTSTSTSTVVIPQRNENVFSGFLPILGLPLSNAKNINSDQDQIDFASFLYGNQFASSASDRQTYARFFSTDTTGNRIVNMSSGSAGRWSYDLSESSTINNGGSAWCAVEAE